MISKNNILELETRKQIYEFIKNNPGLHLQEISRKTKIPKSTLQYHLRYLEKLDIIGIHSKVKIKRYYLTNKVGKQEKEILKLLREKTTRGIIIMLLFQTAISQKELSQDLEKTPKTISYHLDKLIKAGIIEEAPVENGVIPRFDPQKIIIRRPVGREIIYRIKSREIIRTLYILFITHEKSLKYDDIPSFFIPDLKENMKYDHIPYSKIITPKDSIKSVYDTIFEVFPHPYHV